MSFMEVTKWPLAPPTEVEANMNHSIGSTIGWPDFLASKSVGAYPRELGGVPSHPLAQILKSRRTLEEKSDREIAGAPR